MSNQLIKIFNEYAEFEMDCYKTCNLMDKLNDYNAGKCNEQDLINALVEMNPEWEEGYNEKSYS